MAFGGWERRGGFAEVAGPAPEGDLGNVFKMFADVGVMLVELAVHQVDNVTGLGAKPGRVFQGVDDEVIAADLVANDHIERSGGAALVDEAANVEAGFVWAAMNHAVNGPTITVVGKDDWSGLGEERFKGEIVHAMRMLVGAGDNREVDNVDQANFDFRNVLVEEPSGSDCFQGGNVADAGEDHIGIAGFFVAGKGPARSTAGTMLDGFVHIEPLELLLLAASDEVDVIAAPQAMIHHVYQSVRVGRVVDADHVTAASEGIVDETRGLMAESIVIVAPAVAGKKNVE